MTLDQAREAVASVAVELAAMTDHGTSVDLRAAQLHLKGALDEFESSVRADECENALRLALEAEGMRS